ncbi:hypothetical protein ebA1344 [Aromatoleum aromaticum EbN1]|uniref:Uncharacterized protein n=1 Tax=Aromatoleum aromaticum (strain DSM 19018 / LMG 30748 / EbN1) TaxID=76114 RepID=Q5P757_AROAE|nr:hypothetical protein ebA1344 [Aromatoleum aromaticum EbN1]
MSLDALLAKLERGAVTPVTAAVTPDVTPESALLLAVTAVTPVTAQIDNGQGEAARAVAEEPLEAEPDPPAVVLLCTRCRHRARPGHAEPGYCALRTDQPNAYGPGHPLHRLPADGGADCDLFEAWPWA